jgi:hypothetical protein
MIKKILLLLLLTAPSSLMAQKSVYQGFPSLVWPKLYDISFTMRKDELGEYNKPVFTKAVRALANKRITLPGYMVPFESGSTGFNITISSLPLNACFFCGVGGPETVVEVNLKTKTDYIEKPIEVQGILRLNEADPDRLIYILDEAQVMGTLEF